jgi:protocatechuate 3,4-dioxygenase alpha subunit
MQTPSQTIGPFFAPALGRQEMAPVLDGAGEPVSDALIELWDGRRFGRCPTDSGGSFSFTTVEPEAPYIAVSVFARGLLQRLVTRIYLDTAAAPDPSLVAREDGGVHRFDIHLQGERETVFFAV